MQHKKQELARYSYLTASIIYTLIFTVVSFALIAVAAYFFGFNLLRNPLSGNDAMNTLTYASWIKDYYPNLPLWYPLSAGGSSFLLGYPSLYSLSVVIVSKLSGLDLLPSMSVLNFASLLLPAWGVFLFVLLRFHMRVGALFAGLFYLISPISYVLISGAGFLSNAYAAIFGVPFILFLEWYLGASIDGESLRKRLVTLFFAGIFFVLTTLSHPVVMLGFMMLFAFYAIGLGLIKGGVQGLMRGIVALFVASIVFYLMCAFWFKPFQDYTNFSNRDITFVANPDTLPPVKFTGMLGLIGPQTGYPFPNFSVVPLVWVFAAAGTLIAFLRKKFKIFLFGIMALISIYLAGSHDVWIAITKIHWFIGSFFVDRYYYTSTTILLPLVGGVGVWLVCSLPFYWFIERTKNMHGAIHIPTKIILSLVITVIGFGVVVYGFFALNKYSGYYKSENPQALHYGEESGISSTALWNRATITRGIPNYCDRSLKEYAGLFCDNPAVANTVNVDMFVYYCDQYAKADPKNRPYYCVGGRTIDGKTRPLNESDMAEFVALCKNEQYLSPYFKDLCLSIHKTPREQLQVWPEVRIANKSLYRFETTLFSSPGGQFSFLTQPNTRIDVSPSIGSWAKEWGTTAKSSIINAYTGQLVLNKSFNSVFMDTMYRKSDQSAVSVDEIAKYFGIQALLNSDSDQMNRFEERQWKKTEVWRQRYVWEPPFKNSIYSVEKKPLVLVIGTQKNQAYKQVFQLGTLGAIPFDKAIMIEGKEKIDDYSLQELQKYHMLILSGYNYNNRFNALNALDVYVREGGRVFIDTGWQYIAPDWGKSQNGEVAFPPFMPVKKTVWGNVGSSWDTFIIDEQFSENTTIFGFNPLTWGNDPWSLAYADTASLQSWAKPLITNGDKILMAGGDYGSGKIVWSGMNFPSHALNPVNTQEAAMFENIMRYLLQGGGEQVLNFAYTRTPDELSIPIGDTSWSGHAFYFRESYYPYWKARLIHPDGSSVNLPIQTAGPRFMLVKLPQLQVGDRLVFQFDGGWKILVPFIISLLTWMIMILLILDAFFLKSRVLRAFGGLFKKSFSFATRPVKKNMEKMSLTKDKEEEDY